MNGPLGANRSGIDERNGKKAHTMNRVHVLTLEWFHCFCKCRLMKPDAETCKRISVVRVEKRKQVSDMIIEHID